MKIILNGEAMSLADGATIADVLQELGMDGNGVAFAVRDDVVGRDEWESRRLEEGDEVMMIRAVCGG